MEFQLLSSTGQMLENKKIRTHDGMNQYEYTNGQNLENGVYFIQLICQDQKLSRKMVKN
ncbi:MAG: T9SS type A sorting domain-containing protein [Bacteroidetes bacterium]|nr:T9SS type A sorting domain-containing protein [Bacteroidota bacterium]